MAGVERLVIDREPTIFREASSDCIKDPGHGCLTLHR